MVELSNEQLQYILQQYGLHSVYIENNQRIIKIYSQDSAYALKRVHSSQGIDFVRNVQSLYQLGYNRIVPIFPTMDGRYSVLLDHYVYYLMPWLPNEFKDDRTEKNQQLFRELARLHTISTKETEMQIDAVEEHYLVMKEQYEIDDSAIESFIQTSEEQVYMSPFCWLFCSYYRDIKQAMSFATRQLEEWYETAKEVTKWRTVLIHGKLSPEHFLFDEKGNGYFTNFESSRTALPINDILPFLENTLKTYPKQWTQVIEWLQTYFKYAPLRKEEQYLFYSYLVHPTSILRLIEKYIEGSKTITEATFVKQLQQEYWLLQNKEYIVSRFLSSGGSSQQSS